MSIFLFALLLPIVVECQFEGNCPPLPPPRECGPDENSCELPEFNGCPSGSLCIPKMMDYNGEYCDIQQCPLMCNENEMFCSGTWDGFGCPSTNDFCLPMPDNGCPVFCPADCNEEWGEVLCPATMMPDGCMGPDMCMPIRMDINGEWCPASSSCPVGCGEGEMMCWGGIDENGCKQADFCVPPTQDGCPAVCPEMCPPNHIACPGGLDESGCPQPDHCIYSEYNCPTFCPPTCTDDETYCPGTRDNNGCLTPDSCMPRSTSSTGELCPGFCPVTCLEHEAFCPGGIDDNGCPYPDMCMSRTWGFDGELCPDDSVCHTTTCGPDEILCAGGRNCNGCLMADFCAIGKYAKGF